MNQYYSAELAQKVSRGMRETRNKGYFQGGQLLYGYQLDGRKIIINECEAEIVRYMYSEYAKGVYVKDLLKDLAAKGITYKGRPFVRNSVYNILRNEKYSGVHKHGEEVIANMYPQIVPTELYEKVRAIVNKNKFGKRSVKADFLLRHKIKCGYCGQSINAESGTTKNDTGLLLQMQRQEKTLERLPKIYGTQRSFGRTCTQYRYGRIERSRNEEQHCKRTFAVTG